MTWQEILANFIVPGVIGAISGAGVVAYTVGKYKEKIRSLEECCAGERLAKIEGQLMVFNNFSPLTQRLSPISLTDHGDKVLKESGVQEFIDKHYERLSDAVQKCVIDTKYDVQQCSRDTLNDALHGHAYVDEHQNMAQNPYSDDVKPLKGWLFENGYKIEDLTEVGNVYLTAKLIQRFGVTD